jgi:hypothetical protein
VSDSIADADAASDDNAADPVPVVAPDDPLAAIANEANANEAVPVYVTNPVADTANGERAYPAAPEGTRGVEYGTVRMKMSLAE